MSARRQVPRRQIFVLTPEEKRVLAFVLVAFVLGLGAKHYRDTHPQAPPFWTLSSRYPIDNLAESLAEGIVSGHPDMPIFVFSPHDVEAIIQYLQSIQIKKP